jgi:hypothetical protein
MVQHRPVGGGHRLQASSRSTTSSRGGAVVVLDPEGNVVYRDNGGSLASVSNLSISREGVSAARGGGVSSSSSSSKRRGYVVPSPNEMSEMAARAEKDARLERLRMVRQQGAEKARTMVQRHREIQGARREVARGIVRARLDQSKDEEVSGLVERADDALSQVGMAYAAALDGTHTAVLEAQDAQMAMMRDQLTQVRV